MEDSGREKLQGQSPDAVADDAMKNVEAQAEKVDFDSAEIDKNKKVEQFENIEGAEERARAAERAKEDAKRAAEKAKEKAEKLQAKADETPLQKKARHKKIAIISIIILILLTVAGVFLAIRIKEDNKSMEQISKEVIAFAQEANIIAQNGSYENVEKARQLYLDKIESVRGKQKFYYILAYAKFCASHQIGIEECNKYLNEALSMVQDEQQEEDYNNAKCFVYSRYKSEKYYQECNGGTE